MSRRVAIVIALTLTLASCGSDEGGSDASGDAGEGNGGGVQTATGPGLKPAAIVSLEPTTFEPAEVSIPVGKRVVWKWKGGVQHNVHGGDEFKSELQSKGQFAHTFDEAGTFEYLCDVHPTTMKGTVEVTEVVAATSQP